MTRATLRAVCRVLVGVLLFAQMAIAAYACPGLVSASASASASVAATSEKAAACDDMSGAMDPSFPNLCAEHCKYGQQSDQANTLTLPAVLLVALYSTPSVQEIAPSPRLAGAAMSTLVAASPPHAILHCVYRI